MFDELDALSIVCRYVFDELDALSIVRIVKTSEGSTLESERLERSTVERMVAAAKGGFGDECPYDSISFNASHDAVYTRKIVRISSDGGEPPGAIYLDYRGVYFPTCGIQILWVCMLDVES